MNYQLFQKIVIQLKNQKRKNNQQRKNYQQRKNCQLRKSQQKKNKLRTQQKNSLKRKNKLRNQYKNNLNNNNKQMMKQHIKRSHRIMNPNFNKKQSLPQKIRMYYKKNKFCPGKMAVKLQLLYFWWLSVQFWLLD